MGGESFAAGSSSSGERNAGFGMKILVGGRSQDRCSLVGDVGCAEERKRPAQWLLWEVKV